MTLRGSGVGLRSSIADTISGRPSFASRTCAPPEGPELLATRLAIWHNLTARIEIESPTVYPTVLARRFAFGELQKFAFGELSAVFVCAVGGQRASIAHCTRGLREAKQEDSRAGLAVLLYSVSAVLLYAVSAVLLYADSYCFPSMELSAWVLIARCRRRTALP